ncbi:MAG: iron uptake porin [Cyanobacteriota bacterium]|nr:iron uptake porin [Cyanobacteriota bacterium]
MKRALGFVGLGCWGSIALVFPTGAQSAVNPIGKSPIDSLNAEISTSDRRPTTVPPSAQLPNAMPSVEELSDVQPTDWAYQALKSLIERYNLPIGYPDGTFRGDRPLTRYEFAALLQQALDAVVVLRGTGDTFLAEDLEVLERLQANYQLALDDLDDRLTNRLRPRVDRLELENFSPTTQLRGQLIVALTDATEGSATLVHRLRLNLTSRLSGNDRLFTQLEAGNNGGDGVSFVQNQDNNVLGTTGVLAGAGGLDYTEVDSSVSVNRLYYAFEPIERLSVTIGPKIAPADFIDRNRFANNSALDFSSSFFVNNPLIIQNQIDRPGGAGAVVSWDFAEIPLTLTGLYVASTAEDAGKGGLFRDRYQTSLELEYTPSPYWAVRLQYTHAEIEQTNIDAVGLNGEYSIGLGIGLFGRLGFGDYDGFNRVLLENVDANPTSWAAGANLRNWPFPGNFAGVAIGQPFITDDVGDATQTNLEAFYNVQLSDNLTVTPALLLVWNADNDNDSDTIWQGVVRTVFSF